MLRSFKTEINPTREQIEKIKRTIGVCRFIYNFYLSHNKAIYESEKRFVSGMEFSKWLNNEFIPNNPDYAWIKEVSSKAVKQAIMNGEKAFKKFFIGKSKFPRFKKKRNQDVKAYFPKNSATDLTVERHRVKIPTFGWVRLKEKGYLPTNAKVSSCTISQKAGRFYISLLVEVETKPQNVPDGEGIGIDLGIKEFAVLSDGRVFSNINKTETVKKLEKKLKREQKRLSKKYEMKKKRGEKSATCSANVDKQIEKIQRIHQRLANIRNDYLNKIVNELGKTNPAFIALEDLNIKGMMKNRHLSKAIAQQKFYQFKLKVKGKFIVKEVNRFYPSSKTCSNCGWHFKELKLSDRTFECKSCGLTIDRDLNAAINIKNCA